MDYDTMPMHPCPIDRLPEELLDTILSEVKCIVSRDMWWAASMRVCRKWHRIGIGLQDGLGFAMSTIIESDTRRCNVDDEKSSSSISLLTDFRLRLPSNLYLSRLQSLTVHVRHQHIAAPFAPQPGSDMIKSLSTSFRLMNRLITFSLKFADGWDFPILDVPGVPQSLLARLVAALPETVIDLELDTAGADIPPSSDLIENSKEKHLCYQISKILHRLRHLRLRIGHICSNILGFHLHTAPCSQALSCKYCCQGEYATCQLIRSWSMRTMTVWLPWGQKHSNGSFIQASTALLDKSFDHPTIILLVHQQDSAHPDRNSIIEPKSNVYLDFLWIPQSNLSPSVRARHTNLTFGSFPGLTVHPPPPPPNYPHLPHPQRNFYLTLARNSDLPEAGGSTSYPNLAISTIESMLSWIQRGHLSYRFPISESDAPGEMWYKGPEIWYCEFPACEPKGKARLLTGLRGHVMYAHPRCPHHDVGVMKACPAVGCDRVGENGFYKGEGLEEHLRGHFETVDEVGGGG